MQLAKHYETIPNCPKIYVNRHFNNWGIGRGFWSCFAKILCLDVEAYVGLVLQKTRDSIKDIYDLSSWQKLMGGDHKESLHNMCLYALTRKEVRLKDKLNGLTVSAVCDLGILMLTPASDKG
jgi:hypothetical protein